MPLLIPKIWCPPAPGIRRIIFHWTAGPYSPSGTDREHYHILIDGEGRVSRGDHSIPDNIRTGDGDYAAHVRGANTGSIGITVCCMYRARERPFDAGPYPLLPGQWNNLIRGCADLCEAYGISPAKETLLGHHEVERVLGIKQAGKWDVSRTSFPRAPGYKTTGDELRGRVARLLAGEGREEEGEPEPVPHDEDSS